MSSFIAAAIQLSSQPDLEYNFEQIQPMIEKAVSAGARFVGLPENFAFYGDDQEQLRQAGNISKRVNEQLPKWAQEFGIYILGGGYPVPAESKKVYNRSILVNPQGETVAFYNKIHLFDVTISESESYRESDMMKAGEKADLVYNAANLAKIGLSICYDVRFPELYRRMADDLVELITVPSAFTKITGEAHWEVLLRARAIENTAYLIAPAQTGTHGGKRKTYGHASIIDPWGRILAEAGEEPGVITAEIDLNYMNKVRENLPSLKHRVS